MSVQRHRKYAGNVCEEREVLGSGVTRCGRKCTGCSRLPGASVPGRVWKPWEGMMQPGVLVKRTFWDAVDSKVDAQGKIGEGGLYHQHISCDLSAYAW